MARQIKQKQEYLGKLLKLIPSEIIAVYVAVQGLIPGEKWGLTIVTLVLLILTPLYLRFVQKVDRPAQIVISALSFIVWVYCLGGPFVLFGIHHAKIASVILLIWTTFIPQFFNFEPKES
ncbi:MAG: hypothetical protein KAT34_04540 [Candidatus Aminicenantes bacterium]|nr:hypothetical protein [Candidatus Aminicenantes bacterium]